MALELDIIDDVPPSLSLEPTERVVSALISTLTDLPDGVINATFVDRAQSEELNERYSGNAYATDVLSFSYIEDGEPIEGVIGEIAVCLPIAEEQSNEVGIDLPDEVALLILHGILHICGFDHQTTEEQAELGRLQTEIMIRAGNTYREFEWKK